MYKGKIVNFELLYVDGEIYSDQYLADLTYHMIMTDIDSAVKEGHDAIIGLLLMDGRSEEHTSELQSLGYISYAVFCLDRKSVV